MDPPRLSRRETSFDPLNRLELKRYQLNNMRHVGFPKLLI